MELDAPSRDALAQALRSARRSAGISQKELARLTGDQIDQAKISKYETGVNEPPLGTLLAIDKALGNTRGAILRTAELIDTDVSTDDAIVSDPDIPAEVRDALLTFYRLATSGGLARARERPAQSEVLEKVSQSARRRRRSTKGA